ncbi:lipase maturation factor 2 [Onychostruthus taczanowskii]|uniref:lipase maturation factor 2 n=1 Tax=Onychostruthus taczanowskii TaxID=356909 RepID=UPI001B801121|nr:lipase maturation factor 2 [Onychostruthus taczanowskii]
MPGSRECRAPGNAVLPRPIPAPLSAGLYGREGLLPARRVLRLSGKGLWEQLRDVPTLLWLGPRLGLDTEQGMELLCLLGMLAALGALLCDSLRDCLLFALLRVLYLSLYQVGQVFLYFQWDSLLLEAGFLAVLVAPLRLLRWGSPAWRPHDAVTFWAVRWLLFRLMFASGVVKLSSRCPTWWGLTALTYHYESQCIPTPGAWLAHQLPVWLQKLSVVATYVIEVAVPVLFFAPLRRLRLFAFYCQVLLQVLIILTGNYNFFNVLTIVLAFSLLDEEHVGRWLGRPRKRHGSGETPEPTPGCACVRGCFWKLWATLQWAVMATATVSLFAVSLVPFTYIEHESNGKLWPGIHQMFGAVERFQVVNSYGLFRRMTGVGGRPEVILEGSYDGHSWTEIEFMYKPGNVSAAPAVVAPHQPRLDWQLWFAALGPHQSSPWFSALVLRLLQGQPDVIRLVQTDESRYPFHGRPPTFLRAQLYKYWFTAPNEGSPGAAPWWRRQHVQEFFPAVSLGDPTLETLLSQHGLKDKPPSLRRAAAALPRLLGWVRRLCQPVSGPALLWSLYLVAATAGLLRALARRARGGQAPARHKGPRERNGARGTEGARPEGRHANKRKK